MILEQMKKNTQVTVEDVHKVPRDTLERTDKMNNTILDSMKDPAYICSGDHKIQYANPALISLIGEDRLEKKCYNAVFNSAHKCKNCPSTESLTEESVTTQVDITIDKKKRFFQQSVSPIHYQNGSVSRLHILKDVTELIRARDHAARSEKKIKLVADNVIDMVWQMDLRLKFTYLSPSAESILGYQMDEMVGHKLWEFTRRGEFVKMARHAMGAIMDYKNFITTTFETILLHKDGSELPVEITGKLLKDQNGKAVGLQGSTKDISERFKAQAELLKQHHLLRTVVDNIPDMIYVKDLSGHYILNNTGHQKELKVADQKEILNKTDHHFFDEETAAEFYRDEQKIIDSGIPMINKEEYTPYNDGSSRWTLTTKVPIRDEKGGISGIAGIKRDITERKQIEDELVRSRYELALRNKIANIFLTSETDQLFNDVLEIIRVEFNSPFGFFGYINDNHELAFPSMFFKSFGESSVPEKPFAIPQESWSGIWGESLLEKESLFSNQSQKLPILDITVKNVLCVPISIKEELLGQICIGNKAGGYSEKEQQLLGAIALYIAPILHSYLQQERMKLAKEEAFAQLKKAKEKAEESDQLKSAFLLNLSHELRTPLNAILGFSSVIANPDITPDNKEYFTEQISSAGNDLMKMIEDTIAMAQLESGQIELDPVKQRIEKTLREIQSDFADKYNKPYPEIEFHLNDRTEGITIDTDHQVLKNVISNILDNAVKFSGRGKVELGGRRVNGSKLLLYVKDEGIGIPKEMHDNVFEKFRKVENSEIIHRGNGLGLSISKGLIEKIGGSIHLDSSPGEGTCVTISLPITPTE